MSSAIAYRRTFEVRLANERAEREAQRTAALEAVRTIFPAIIAKHPSAEKIYLFGSILHEGRFSPASDIDVGVVGISAEAYFALWRDLEAAFPSHFIDLRDVDAGSYFGRNVQLNGQLIYERTSSAVLKL